MSGPSCHHLAVSVASSPEEGPLHNATFMKSQGRSLPAWLWSRYLTFLPIPINLDAVSEYYLHTCVPRAAGAPFARLHLLGPNRARRAVVGIPARGPGAFRPEPRLSALRLHAFSSLDYQPHHLSTAYSWPGVRAAHRAGLAGQQSCELARCPNDHRLRAAAGAIHDLGAVPERAGAALYPPLGPGDSDR